jgi:carbonic anhydrase
MSTRNQEVTKTLSSLALLLLLCASTASAQALLPSATLGGEFGYKDAVGPNNWGTLPGSALCSTGTKQTPIALGGLTQLPLSLFSPAFSYSLSPVRMFNDGSTVQFEYLPGSFIAVGGQRYRLAQFHFHTPSEHTLNGQQYPLELHLVHVDDNGAPAVVVGVFITTGAENAALATAFRNLPKKEGDISEPSGAFINAAALLPSNRTLFTYEGSLTTPPCSEGIQWFVMANPIQMSDAQIAQYQRLPHLNPSNRPLQPLNGRIVLKHLDLL